MNQLYKQLIDLLYLVAFITLCSSCGLSNERDGCDGYPQIQNTLRDTSQSRLDTLRIDLSGGGESVFKHSTGKTLSFHFLYDTINMSIDLNYKNNNSKFGSFANVRFHNTGTYVIRIIATDECDKINDEDISITVTN